MGFLDIFDGCPGVISFFVPEILDGSWRNSISVLEIFDGCPGDI